MNATWTEEELKEFERLVDMVSSRSQLARINGRLSMRHFVEEHGTEKCDAMFAFIEKRDGETP